MRRASTTGNTPDGVSRPPVASQKTVDPGFFGRVGIRTHFAISVRVTTMRGRWTITRAAR